MKGEKKDKRRWGYIIEDAETYSSHNISAYNCSVCTKTLGIWQTGLTSKHLPKYCMWCGVQFAGVENAKKGNEQND